MALRNKAIGLIILLAFTFYVSCGNTNRGSSGKDTLSIRKDTILPKIICGADQSDKYLSYLTNKRIAILVNQSATVEGKHLLDFLVEKKIAVKKVFAPEHGFRGDLERGKEYKDFVDPQSGVPVVSLFGNHKKPISEDLKEIDLLIFDIQDVGVRFFTYISSMHLAMEACAENNVEFMVMDRPNPLGDYVDGSVLENKYKSFVGMHPIPIVHGCTVGELAKMINGEKWLKDSLQCKLKVIEIQNYTHKSFYSLPIKPSPNLTNDIAIRLYPSLCLFEASSISVGRGTDFPFQVLGFPDSTFGDFTFTPVSKKGMETQPLHQNKKCYGLDLRKTDPATKFTLQYLILFYKKMKSHESFFTNPNWFHLLSGNNVLESQIKEGLSEDAIKKSWQKDLEKYKRMRKKYLLYSDFE